MCVCVYTHTRTVFFFFFFSSTMLTTGLFWSFIEPTTSRASLNFQEYVLSRPPLSRSQLHFPPLDASSPNLGTSSSLFSQPSTSSAPGPFSTGFSLVKEIKDNLSQHEDDNISTTSGFSSRASDKGTEKGALFAFVDMNYARHLMDTVCYHHSSKYSNPTRVTSIEAVTAN